MVERHIFLFGLARFCFGSSCMDAENPETRQYQRARFVTQLPVQYLYTPSHFWIARHDNSTWRIGFTKFASRMLGEMVDYGFDVLLEAEVVTGQRIGWVEGFKAISDLFCIAQGRFAGPNPSLETDLALVNRDPLGAGWLYLIKGQPDPVCVSVDAYVRILDQTIDRILGKD